MSKVFGAKVKNVLSGDTLVLAPPNGGHQERLLSLAHIQAPRLSSNEKYGFESRELLRKLLVGKTIRFWVLYKSQSEREFGDVSSPIFSSLIEYVLEKGSAKVRDNGNDEDETFAKLKSIEAKAQQQKVGLWNPNAKPVTLISRPEESSMNKQLPAIVERVISGDRIMVRLCLGGRKQCVVPILISGIKCPRTSNGETPAEPYADQAKYFVENHLLAADVKVLLIGESSSGVLVGKVFHPAGNIAEIILENGLGEVADWQSALIGVTSMTALRTSERSARAAQKGLWKKSASSAAAAAADTVAVGGKDLSAGAKFEATVARIISADTVDLRLKDDSEVTVQLASLRGPRKNDPSTSPFVDPAREFLRSKAIGRHVDVTVESVRPANDQYEERAMVSLDANGADLAQLVVSSGYAQVLQHRRGEEAPANWDELIECESQAKKLRKGIWGKAPEPERVVDASENATKAKPYLFTFEGRGTMPAVVDYIISATRFVMRIPRENLKLVLVLGGLESRPKNDPLAKESLGFANKKALQRDVKIEIYGQDRTGGFIGNLYLTGATEPFQVSLLEHGYAKCHERSLNQTRHPEEFENAEAKAVESKAGLWAHYDAAADAELATKVEELKIEKKYYDAEVSEVLRDGRVAIQLLDADHSKLKAFMQKFHAASKSFGKYSIPPKKGEIVAAKFSDNGKFYRDRVLGYDKVSRKCEVEQIDYGTIESVPLSDVRALPAEFQVTAYKPQAHIIQLSLLKPAPNDYLEDAIYFLEDEILDKQVVVCQTFKNPAPGIEMDAELYDSKTIATDPTFSINKKLVKEGWALVKKSDLEPFEKLLESDRQDLLKLEAEAKSAHRGIWRYGDVEGDESL